jgi:glycosyltransferase involved in cell wall biosynthesis
MGKSKKVIFVSESIRRDAHAPLKFFDKYEIRHFYLNAPYGDMDSSDLIGSEKVTLSNILDRIIAEQPDIIQGPEPFGSRLALRLSNICLKAKHITGAKLVVPVLENRPIAKRFNLAQRAVLKLFCLVYFKSCDAIVALNRGAVANVKNYYKGAKIKTGIVWGVWGVDMNVFKPSGKKNKREILYVGRIIEDKGLYYLFEGFGRALKKFPDLKLKIAGSGNLKDELISYANKYGFEKNIEFLGMVKNRNLPEIFSRAELCVYPSITMKRWEEQVGTVNFQALSCGTPVLTTKSGAIPEYIKEGQGAMLVPERDSISIEKAIIRFFSDSKLKAKLTKTSRPAIRRYGVKEQIKKAQELFDEII